MRLRGTPADSLHVPPPICHVAVQLSQRWRHLIFFFFLHLPHARSHSGVSWSLRHPLSLAESDLGEGASKPHTYDISNAKRLRFSLSLLHRLAPSQKGPDSVIPGNIISGCKGIAIITIAKAGFLVTARAGAGLVVARSAAGWSAPSALGVAGIGGGFELGVEITDFLLVLNTDRAVSAFSKGTNVTFGANLTIAVGPLGRNAEASVSARSVASVYSYSKSKGLFGGISLEASTLIERKETNHKFYGDNSLRACAILQGDGTVP